MPWKFNANSPIYLQICEQMRRDILTGRYPLGADFPSVRELAMEAGVNPNTMQRSMQELERDGYLITSRTAGRTVTQDATLLDTLRNSLAEKQTRAYVAEMESLGFDSERLIAFIHQTDMEGDRS